LIDEIYEAVKKSGATGGKISGAGGGGFMTIYAPGNSRYQVMNTLEKFGGSVKRFNFTQSGMTSWSI